MFTNGLGSYLRQFSGLHEDKHSQARTNKQRTYLPNLLVHAAGSGLAILADLRFRFPKQEVTRRRRSRVIVHQYNVRGRQIRETQDMLQRIVDRCA
eukprot:scaffold3_cov389-Prasinococcus_capsulatus_cf.AAC.4